MSPATPVASTLDSRSWKVELEPRLLTPIKATVSIDCDVARSARINVLAALCRHLRPTCSSRNLVGSAPTTKPDADSTVALASTRLVTTNAAAAISQIPQLQLSYWSSHLTLRRRADIFHCSIRCDYWSR